MELHMQAYIVKDLEQFRKTEGVISAEMITKNVDGTIWITALVSHPKGRIYGDNIVHFEESKPIGINARRNIRNLI